MTGIQTKMSLAVLVSAFLFLTACGESDSGSASAPTSESAAETAAALAEEAKEAVKEVVNEEDDFDINNIEKAEGVVYQDEIYANWPYDNNEE